MERKELKKELLKMQKKINICDMTCTTNNGSLKVFVWRYGVVLSTVFLPTVRRHKLYSMKTTAIVTVYALFYIAWSGDPNVLKIQKIQQIFTRKVKIKYIFFLKRGKFHQLNFRMSFFELKFSNEMEL
jgi:hypothetical protein